MYNNFILQKAELELKIFTRNVNCESQKDFCLK